MITLTPVALSPPKMRVLYQPPSPKDFDILFSSPLKATRKLKGGGIDDINPFYSDVYNQRGSGILSVIGNIFRRSVPFLRKYVFPTLQNLGSELLNDFTQGADMKESLKTHGTQAIKKVLSGGRKRKRHVNKMNTKENKKRKVKNNKPKRKPKVTRQRSCSKQTMSIFD